MDLVAALDAGDGVTCVVGAGGKKSTLYALADRIERAVVTATVRIPVFDGEVTRVAVTEDPVAAVADADADDWPLGLVPERERADRYRGYDTAAVDALATADAADAVLVKADGARMRLFKAPGEREPQVPGCADTVVPVASVHAVGKPLTDEHVHRVERVAALTGRDPGERIRPEDVAAVLASPEGGRREVPDDATVVPLLNMVDDADLDAAARAVAGGIHARTDVPRVVLTRLTAPDPVVDVVT